MRWTVLAAALLALTTALGIQPARASITIDLTAETRVDTVVTVKVSAANHGTEPAHEVQPEVRIRGETQQRERIAILAPGDTHVWEASTAVPADPGFFPIEVLVRYADANAYPLSALLVQVARTPGASAGPATVTVGRTQVATSGAVRVTVGNPGPRPLAGRVSLMLPAEFQTAQASQPLDVPAQGTAAISVPIENAGALPGSTYPTYAVFEYEAGDFHQAAVGSVGVEVVATSTTRLPLVVGAIALVVALAALGATLLLVRRGRAISS
ncbi:MAG: hypothetical protein U0807_10595 [Candidatus Binatia bacterium]